MADERKRITILVHPGSACGSADFNLGKYDARAARDGLVLDLQAADGDFFVIDGGLSDELEQFPVLAAAIEAALHAARARGDLAERIMGSDDDEFDQCDAARELIERHGLSPQRHVVSVTGAWYDPDDESGCVNSVLDVFVAAGFPASIADNAVALAIDGDDEDDAITPAGSAL